MMVQFQSTLIFFRESPSRPSWLKRRGPGWRLTQWRCTSLRRCWSVGTARCVSSQRREFLLRWASRLIARASLWNLQEGCRGIDGHLLEAERTSSAGQGKPGAPWAKAELRIQFWVWLLSHQRHFPAVMRLEIPVLDMNELTIPMKGNINMLLK